MCLLDSCSILWAASVNNSIYAAGNTVPIPFLRATETSPIALLLDNVLGCAQTDSNSRSVTVEALQELFTAGGQA